MRALPLAPGSSGGRPQRAAEAEAAKAVVCERVGRKAGKPSVTSAEKTLQIYSNTIWNAYATEPALFLFFFYFISIPQELN